MPRSLMAIGAAATVWLVAIYAAAAEPVRREVLAIYDERVEPEPSATLIHLRLEAALNHLGYVVDYHGTAAPLPDAAALDRYAGVVTWFLDDIADPDAYLDWATRAAGSGMPFVVIGHPGVALSQRNLERINRILAGAGVAYTPEYVEVTTGSEIVGLDPAIVGFERPLDPVLPPYPIAVATDATAQAALVVRAPALEAQRESVLVSTGASGGHAAAGFEIHHDPVLNATKWIIDPFAFLSRALGTERFPVPDTTTISGRRLYFSHVDGDGWFNLSEMEEHRKRPTTAAEVMLQELIAPYPDLPVSVGLVASDVDPELGGGEAAAAIARAIYALPQVEVASHTHTHPFRWRFFEDYDRAQEERLIDEANGTRAPQDGFLARLRTAAGLARPEGSARERYVAGSPALPRAYLRDPFDLQREIGGALETATALAPEGKEARLYLWSGDTRPFAAALANTRAAGVRNMNGGDGRLDAQFPSIGYLAPIGRETGDERQIYAVASNENTYTDLWTAHFHGFSQLAETIARTETPRRLKGVNVYYHTYSAEKRVSLEAVRGHLDWAREAPLTPIEASLYAAIADGFFTTRIERLDPRRWRISDRDGLQTVRFDDADRLAVAITASVGVLGSNRHAGSLYVSLDPDVATVEVALDENGATARAAGLEAASLTESRWLLRDLSRSVRALRFEARGYGPGFFRFSAIPPGDYAVSFERGGRTMEELAIVADAQGELAFVAPVDGMQPVLVRIAPLAPARRRPG
jgi:hypothetical protein